MTRPKPSASVSARSSDVMKRVWLLAGLLMWMVCHPLASSAQAVPERAATQIFMVVDIQHVLQNAKASASIQRQIDGQREVYQKEIALLETELRQAERTLQEQRTLINPEEFDRRRRSFEKRVAEVQTLVQSRRQILEQGYGAATAQIRSEMLKIIARIAEREQVSLVLSKQQVVMVDRGLERTEAVLKALDEVLPDVRVNLQ